MERKGASGVIKDTVARRFVTALGSGSEALLDELYAEDAVLYAPVAVLHGSQAIKRSIAEFHEGFPRFRVALHDEFYDADSGRGLFAAAAPLAQHRHLPGHAPTNTSGTTTETHSLTIEDGRIVEQVVGASTFQLPRLLLEEWQLDFPRDVADPQPALFTASPAAPPDALALAGHREPSLALRFVDAFGRRDLDALDEVYAENVELYTPLGWPVRGRAALKEFADEFHAANPGPCASRSTISSTPPTAAGPAGGSSSTTTTPNPSTETRPPMTPES